MCVLALLSVHLSTNLRNHLMVLVSNLWGVYKLIKTNFLRKFIIFQNLWLWKIIVDEMYKKLFIDPRAFFFSCHRKTHKSVKRAVLNSINWLNTFFYSTNNSRILEKLVRHSKNSTCSQEFAQVRRRHFDVSLKCRSYRDSSLIDWQHKTSPLLCNSQNRRVVSLWCFVRLFFCSKRVFNAI